MEGCGLGIVIGLVVFVVMAIAAIAGAGKMESEKNKKIEDAKNIYQDALLRLKKNPTNSDLRQNTLNLGRTYSNLARDSKGVTIFDEMALMNDINAACGGAGNTPAPIIKEASQSVEERLNKLADLKSKGLINDREFEEKRKQILNDV